MNYITAIFVVLFSSVTAFTLAQTKFGKLPSGERLERVRKSPNYKNGSFQNQNYTPVMTEGVSYYTVLKEFLFSSNNRRKPANTIPSKKINLHTLSRDTDVLVWFGHSSYFMQISGKRFLVDPVLCGSASPIKPTTRSFKGSDAYTPDDIPEIDYLLITHDHWDHLDFETLVKLKPKIKHIVTGLGVGSHLEHWGFSPSIINEGDWYDTVKLDTVFSVTITPSRHFSGRLFKRNQTLWASFVVKTPSLKIFIAGDGGYDTHFSEIGNKYGPFDIAMLECGQYDPSWKYIHLMPEEVVQVSQDLHASSFMPVHWAKFQLGNHSWDDPIIRVNKVATFQNKAIICPMIGETVNLQDSSHFVNWWTDI